MMRSMNIHERIPFCVTLLGMIGGVFIAILFGINEGIFKDRIASQLAENPKYSETESSAVKKEASKNWRYFQRFHFHSTGIGAMSLGILLLLFFVPVENKCKTAAGYLTSVGGFFYPYYWLFAALYGPAIGRGAAKSQFALLGYTGGLFLVGVCITLALVAKHGVRR